MTVDAAGDVVSVTVDEPRFTPADVDVLLASRRKENEARGAHGLSIAEATDPDNQGRFKVGEPVRDFAQQKLDAVKEAYRSKWGDKAEMGSLYFRVELDG